MRRFFIPLLFMFFLGCNNQQNSISIQGLWIFNNEINVLYTQDTNNFGNDFPPILVDFRPNNSVHFKRPASYDTVVSWSFKSDSTLVIDSLNYIVKEFTDKKLVLLDTNRPDTYLMYFSRPMDDRFSQNTDFIKNKTLRNSWLRLNDDNHDWERTLEFYQRGVYTSRGSMDEYNYGDTIESIGMNSWNIMESHGFYFIYSHFDFLNQFSDRLYQVDKIDNDSLIFFEWKLNEPFKVAHFNFRENRDSTYSKLNLIGRWSSTNTITKSYGKLLPNNMISQGRAELFEGPLEMIISPDSVVFNLDSLQEKYRYQVSSDGKVLMLDTKVDNDMFDGLKFEYLFLYRTNDSSFSAVTSKRIFYTDTSHPSTIYINLFQDFKIENKMLAKPKPH